MGFKTFARGVLVQAADPSGERRALAHARAENQRLRNVLESITRSATSAVAAWPDAATPLGSIAATARQALGHNEEIAP